MNNCALVQRVIDSDDHKAFAELVERYQRMVVATCRGFVESYHEAEDLAQDVFVKLYESLPGFRREAKLSTWIYRIAVNKSLNHIRRRKREVGLFGLSLPRRGEAAGEQPLQVASGGNTEADHGILLSESRRMLKEAINRLPENQRAAIILSKYQDLSYREIAEVMEVSVSSVESLLFRAKANLRKYLADYRKK